MLMFSKESLKSERGQSFCLNSSQHDSFLYIVSFYYLIEFFIIQLKQSALIARQMNREMRTVRNNSMILRPDAEIIDELKQKLHKSFLQISEIEKIYEGQLQSQKESYQVQISKLERQNKELKEKLQKSQKGSNNPNTFFQTSFQVNNPLFQSQASNSNSFLSDSCIVNWVKMQSPANKVQNMSSIEKSITESLKFVPKQLYDYFRLAHQVEEQNSRLRAQIIRSSQENAANEQFLRNSLQQRKRLQEVLQKSRQDNCKIAEMYQQQLIKYRNMQLKIQSPHFERTAKNFKIQDQQIEMKQNKQQQSSKIKLSSIISPRNITRKSQYNVREKVDKTYAK